MPHNVSVRIEDANLRDRGEQDLLLAPRLAEQAFRRELGG
jgi:hypothetical protein